MDTQELNRSLDEIDNLLSLPKPENIREARAIICCLRNGIAQRSTEKDRETYNPTKIVLGFGKYKGMTVAEVGLKDKAYLEWVAFHMKQVNYAVRMSTRIYLESVLNLSTGG